MEPRPLYDTAKLLLQGGLRISAVKYEKVRMFINNSTFYITTNSVPNFRKEEDANVKDDSKYLRQRACKIPIPRQSHGIVRILCTALPGRQMR